MCARCSEGFIVSPEGVGDSAEQSSCLRVDNLQDVLSQHVLIFEFHNWDVVVAWAFEDCQPDCLEYSEVRGGITSIDGMVSAVVGCLVGRWEELEAQGGWSRQPLPFQARPSQT